MHQIVRSLLLTVAIISFTSGSQALAAMTGTLYGVWFQSGQLEAFSIDPATGVMTPLVATGATALTGGISTFDPVSKRFFFVSGSDLYVVNVVTGTVSHTTLANSPLLLQFDMLSGVLYGAAYSGDVEVFSINPATGVMTPLVDTGTTVFTGGISTFDPITKRLFFVSGPDLYVVNVMSGNVSHTSLANSPLLLQFDMLSGVLYGAAYSGNVEVFSINPTTGVMTPLVDTGTTVFTGGISTFDPISKRLFFMSNPDLYVVNVLSGTVSHTSLGGSFPLLQFDPAFTTIPAVTLPVAILLIAALAAVGVRKIAF